MSEIFVEDFGEAGDLGRKMRAKRFTIDVREHRQSLRRTEYAAQLVAQHGARSLRKQCFDAVPHRVERQLAVRTKEGLASRTEGCVRANVRR